jgi:hypothetical protein
MPITLGILAQSRQAAPSGAFQLLESTVLTGNQASIEFTNLTTKYAAIYQHLQLRAVTRVAEGTTIRMNDLRFNGDSAANYSNHIMIGDSNASIPYGSGAGNTNQMNTFYGTGSGNAANSFGAGVIDILDAFETTKFKTVRTFGGQTGYSIMSLTSGAWRNNNSITSITFFSQASNTFVAGTRLSLYGIKATA